MGPNKETEQTFTFGLIWNEKLLDSNIINNGPTTRVIFHTRICKNDPDVIFLSLKGPRVGIPALNTIQSLKINGL